MPGTLILDIETTVDPAMPPYRPETPDAFPPPPYWRIETVGACWLDDNAIPRKLSVLRGSTEAERVAAVVCIVQGQRGCRVVTFGGRNFDLPVITGAAMRAGIQFPRRFSAMSKRYDSSHEDLFDALGDFGACRSAGSLDAWSRSLGWPGKIDDSGKRVADLLAEGKREHVEVYCLGDVALTAGVFLRLEHCRGDLSDAGYQASVTALLELAAADVRLGVWLGGVDRDRVLCVQRAAAPAMDAAA